jgi:hypothetical protein
MPALGRSRSRLQYALARPCRLGRPHRRSTGRGRDRAEPALLEVFRHDALRDRRGGAASVQAVLDEDRDRDLRIVGGRERCEPGVIAEPHRDLQLLQAAHAIEADDLHRARLACDANARNLAAHAGAARHLDDGRQALAHDREVGRGDARPLAHLGRELLERLAVAILDP